MGQTPLLQLPYPELPQSADTPRDMKALADKLDVLGYVPVGAMLMWALAAAPARWLVCNGSSYDISAWPMLGALLGESPAGSGKFVVPNLAGRVALGSSPTHPLSGPGSSGGAEAVALTTGQLPAHTHGVSDPGHAHGAAAGYTGAADRGLGHAHSYVAGGGGANFSSGSGTVINRGVAGYGAATGGEGAPDHLHAPPAITVYGAGTGVSVQNAGGGAVHENMPPYMAINYIIRAG